MESIFFFNISYQKRVSSYTYYPKRALNTKISENFFKYLILAEIYDKIFGHSKWIYWIFIYGNFFVLFLVVDCNNPIENISNSMTIMIYSSIKSRAGRRWNLYITKSLELHKCLINCLMIKIYTIFRKQIIWIFWICYQKKVYFYI